MELYVQYPDLTECSSIGYKPVPLEQIKTEFAFGVAAPTQDSAILKDMGFKHVSSMNNWWPSHKDQDRELKLFWLKLKGRCKQPAHRTRWMYNRDGKYAYIEKDLAQSGCGFKIGHPPLVRASFYQFFSLLRMPAKVSPLRTKWLTENHFRLLDTGAASSYWCNGWDPKEWNIKMEKEFFKDFKDERYEAWPKGAYWVGAV